ncbi:hypothetical protein [Acidaminococcus massiliensis]|uniref:hypothetical protein n=1 Tax=Acidaminococcus massiliensis TaxID=1852375 RepID=UPI00248F2282|nr:hypothetical protein [Acidaminococcus massiliensis]
MNESAEVYALLLISFMFGIITGAGALGIYAMAHETDWWGIEEWLRNFRGKKGMVRDMIKYLDFLKLHCREHVLCDKCFLYDGKQCKLRDAPWFWNNDGIEQAFFQELDIRKEVNHETTTLSTRPGE